MSVEPVPTAQMDGLRERLVAAPSVESGSSATASGQETPVEDSDADKNQQKKKTFGRTPDGTGKFLSPECKMLPLPTKVTSHVFQS